MMVVVADTSPINYLILIGEIGVLQQLYHRVVIPEEVFGELMDTEAPPEVRETQKPISDNSAGLSLMFMAIPAGLFGGVLH
jgi:hypothetical protein